MNWFVTTLGSSIGKKLMMALTGLSFCLFLAAHLAGNMTLYGGADAFNLYAETLHKLGPLVVVMEWGLLFFALTHVITGIFLFFENRRARPSRYAVDRSAGGRSPGSITMPYTGVFLLLFIIVHLMNFHFVDKTGVSLYGLVSTALSKPIYGLFYTVAMAAAALHISHGLWSAFQSLGINHEKYMPLIRAFGLVFSIVVGIGFGFIPIYFLIG